MGLKAAAAPAPYDPEELVAALRQQGARYWDSHPFHARLHGGELTAHELRVWASNRWYYQRCLPMKDAAIISNCPIPEVRRIWVERVLYHDGRAEGSGGIANWLRLAEAVGLCRDEVLDERHVVPGVRFAVDAYLRFARERSWVESVAAGLTEMFSPDLMRRRVDAMRRHYPWIEPGGLAYFESRLDVTTSDGSRALDLVVQHCRTRAEQDAAIDALRFKCDVLWAMLDAIDSPGRS